MAMPNARNKNRARLQSVCAALASKRTGGHSAFVSRNQAYALAFLALIGPHRRFPPMWYHSRDTNSRRTVKSPRTPVSRPRSVNRPKSSSDGIRACMRLLLAACGLTGRHYMPVDHMCCLFPCKTPEKKIVHVFSLSALPRTASVPVDIQPSCLRIRPAPLLFGH